MNKTVVITGATGLIGKKISQTLLERGDKVVALTRNASKASGLLSANTEIAEWDFKSVTPQLIHILSNCDSVIHLAGENLFSKRWNDEHKKRAYSSRVNSTKHLVDAVMKSDTPPSIFISASAVGYYGLETPSPVDEYSPCGDDFLARLTKDWEAAATPLEKLNIRMVKIRTGIVLEKKEGALAKMLLPFKLFIGGPLGSGRQPFPWIHVNDICGLFIYALDNNTMNGIYNGAAPENLSMKEFCTILGRIMKRPSFMNVPAFALKILYGEGADMLLNGTAVLPNRTLESGFRFRFSRAKDALKDLL